MARLAATSMNSMAQLVRHYSAPAEGAIPASKQRFIPSTTHIPQGFLFGSAHAGVKASNKSKDDIAVIHSTAPCSAAAVFTQNRFQAAPVTVSRDVLRRRKGQGIKGVVINSGCANAVTGARGLEDARTMSVELDHALQQQEGGSGSSSGGSSEPSSLVMSTGVIGQPLPITRIVPAVSSAIAATDSTHDAFLRVASAICTTDTFPKLSSRQFSLPSFPGVTFSICGTTKGAGMIHPNMATLLGIMCTDAPVAPGVLDSVLRKAVERSFNCISIDGDTSTNDTVALLANGAAGRASPLYKSAPPAISNAESEDAQALGDAVAAVAGELAKLVIRDGEGATKFVTLRVSGARDFDTGKRIASTVARSPLVKTALYGKDANWGRILCAVGYTEGLAEGAVDPAKVSVSFVRESDGEELRLLVDGEPVDGGVDEEQAGRLLQDEELLIEIRLGGQGETVDFWTCDLSHEYVTINGDYRT